MFKANEVWKSNLSGYKITIMKGCFDKEASLAITLVEEGKKHTIILPRVSWKTFLSLTRDWDLLREVKEELKYEAGQVFKSPIKNQLKIELVRRINKDLWEVKMSNANWLTEQMNCQQGISEGTLTSLILNYCLKPI